MKRILLLTFALFAFLCGLSAQITRDQADAIVSGSLCLDMQGYYPVYAKDGIQTEMTITTGGSETIELDYACWVYYIKYRETDYYMIVNESNGNLLEVKSKKDAVPEDLAEWRIVEITNDEGFCAYVSLENIHKTIPLANQFLCGLDKKMENEQRRQALVTWFKSFPCILDARIIRRETPSGIDVAFSFMDDGIVRELILDFSTANKVVSYHYDIVNGASVKTNNNFTIDKVFDFINSIDLDVEYIYNGVYVSTLPSNNLQYILDCLNAKPYTNDGNAWWVTGYLHYLTNQIYIFPNFYHIKNKEYQEDWLQSIEEFKLEERPGSVIVFQIPENPENKGFPQFDAYEFVEWVEYRYHRYTISDQSIGEEEDICDDVKVDSKINIRLVETYTTSPRTLQLVCSTAEILSCSDLIAICQQSSNNIDISFKGVTEHFGACIGEPYPATIAIDLGELSVGTYNLNLYNGNVKYKAKLIVTPESYDINLVDNSYFQVTNTPLNKIPEHTIWGGIGYSKPETSTIAQSFLNELMDAGATKKSYYPGRYQEFEIDANGDIVQPGNEPGYSFAQSFIFNYSENIAVIEQLIKKYAFDNQEGNYLSIAVYTDKGEEILSWVLK